MTPFSTALNVAGTRQSTPQAILPKPQIQPKPAMPIAVLPKRKPSGIVTKQVSDYGKAMQSAIKNTKTFR